MDNLVSGIPVYLAIPGAVALIALASFIAVKVQIREVLDLIGRLASSHKTMS